MSKWQPIETAPKNKKLLIAFKNSLGRRRVIIGCYHTALPWSDDYRDVDESEFAPEGWYEESETHETIHQIRFAPDLWMDIPYPKEPR